MKKGEKWARVESAHTATAAAAGSSETALQRHHQMRKKSQRSSSKMVREIFLWNHIELSRRTQTCLARSTIAILPFEGFIVRNTSKLHQKSSKITYYTRKLTKINLLWIKFNFCCRSCQTPSQRSLQLEQAKYFCSCCSLITASCPCQRLIDAVNSKCQLFVRGTLILFSEVRFRYSTSKNYFIVTAATVCVHPFLVSAET